MGVTNGPARTHRETAALAKKSFFPWSVVTPTFVDGAFVALNMTNILPVGPITISVFLVTAILVWESLTFSENPLPVSHGISSPCMLRMRAG